MSSHNSNVRNIPKLRFSEFDGEWTNTTLGNIFKRITSKNTENNNNVLTISAQQGLINQEKFFTKSVSAKDITGYYLLRNGDFAYNKSYSKGYPMGAIKRLRRYEKGVVSTLYICFRLKNENYIGKFFEKYFDGGFINHEINKIAQEGARNHGLLNMSVSDFFEDINLKLPKPEEQQKIALFLSTVDKWIDNLKKQKEAFENYKKGMMQKIFSQKIRFKDENGRFFPDWEEKKLGEAVDISMGQSPSSKAYNNKGEGTYLIQGNADIKNRITSPRFWTTDITKTCNVGDIILTVRAPSGCVALSKHQACIGRGVCAINANESSYNEFIYQFLMWFEPRWRNVEQGSTFSAISGDDIRKLKIDLPSKAEQQKIAEILNSLDNLINLKQLQISEAEQWKKGLMQRMFI